MNKALGMGLQWAECVCVFMSVCMWLCVILKAMAWWAQLFVWQRWRHSSNNCVQAERNFQTRCPRPHWEVTISPLPLDTCSCSVSWQLLRGEWVGHPQSAWSETELGWMRVKIKGISTTTDDYYYKLPIKPHSPVTVQVIWYKSDRGWHTCD